MSRVLNDNIEKYLLTPSATRDVIVRYVKERLGKGAGSVALCFRGNYATLYYHCHQLLRIRSTGPQIIGEFDFRHSRFTKDYAEKRKLLESYGVNFSKFKEDIASRRHIGFFLNGKGAVAPDNLVKILDIFKELINDFINPELKEYQYDIPESVTDRICRNKTKNVEKDRQQQLYSEYFYRTDETYYDLEYMEPRAKEKGVAGRIDLLGIKRSADSFILELVELKSTKSACGGKAGILKHEKDYLNYINSKFVEDRKIEACAVMQLLSEILNKPCFDGLSPDKLGAEIKFIFTDYATDIGRGYIQSAGIIKEFK